MKAKKLNSKSVLTAGNMKMPLVGLGTWQSKEAEIDVALTAAIEVGYRHIDTAYVYGNEAYIGNTLKKLFRANKVKREDLFIVTKLPHFANRPEYVETYITKSLEALQLDYLDLYLIHNPVGLLHGDGTDFFPKKENGELALDLEVDHLKLWKAMEAQVDAGRTKAIGVSNFSVPQLKRIVENCRIRPANIQVEMHIYLQQKELLAYCNENGITVVAYGPLGSPGLEDFSKTMGIEQHKSLAPLKEIVVAELADKYGRQPSQILLRFLLQLGVAVIPKSVNPFRILQNFDLFSFELTSSDFDRLLALDKGEEGRLFGMSSPFALFKDHPEFPFPTN